MRLSRMLAVPIACMALFAALAFSSPMAGFEPGIAVAASYEAPDFMLATADIETAALVEEHAAIDAPADAHRAAYVESNQPLAAWRFAADSYSRIDPHRRLI